MSRTWSKYINNNKYSECQLITALNAYYCLTGKVYCKQDSQEYEDLVDLVGARHGAAIDIEKAWKKLGIEIVWEGFSLLDLKMYAHRQATKTGGKSFLYLPIDFNNMSSRYRCHSTLIVDYEPRCDAYRITNFLKHTSPDGWIFGSDLYKYEDFIDIRDNDVYRLFGLKGDKKYKALTRHWQKSSKEWFKTYRDYYKTKCKELGI